MIFEWFNAKEAEKFGVTLADFFAQRIASDSMPTNDKKTLRKVSETTSKLISQAENFAKLNKMNTYKKAKLSNTFQNRLFELDYDRKVVQDLVNILVRSL
jgi:hypothetical protein